jgi:hypothetical protein
VIRSSFFSLSFFFFLLLSCRIELISLPLAAKEFSERIELASGYHIELAHPQSTKEGIFTTNGGLIWGEDFRLQAQCIHQWKTAEGEQMVEASGDLMLFYNGFLLIGDRLDYNLSQSRGSLYNGAMNASGGYIGGKKIHLYKNRSFEIDQAWLSSDPKKKGSWKVGASNVFVSPRKFIEIKNLNFRLLGLPLLYIPRIKTSQDASQLQPLDYDIVWKGQKKRKGSIRYHFYASNFLDLWARLEYHLGRGPGIGFDAKIRSNGSVFESTNFVTRDASLSDETISTRYRLKGHYQNPLSKTAHLDLYYDRHSDSDMPKDYSFNEFDRRAAAQTLLQLRDQRQLLVHQLTYRIKVNPFQTVKKELPSYFLTPYPTGFFNSTSPFNRLLILSHWRAEYLCMDFRSFSQLPSYHSMRILNDLKFALPFSIGPLNVSPKIGWKFIGYNDHKIGRESQVIFAPICNLQTQMSWLKSASVSHLITAIANFEHIGSTRHNVDAHYIFDYRDAVSSYTLGKVALKQNWSLSDRPILGLELQVLQFFSHFTTHPKRIYELQAEWYAHRRWKISSQINFNAPLSQILNFNFRSENTWTHRLASVIEFRRRSKFYWTKANDQDFNLEAVRSYQELKTSALSDQRSSLIAQLHYRLNPNWALRFDTVHGWRRRSQKAYQQYCAGLGTDVGGNWRMQLQITKTPEDWDWRIRLDLRDGPVTAPGARF